MASIFDTPHHDLIYGRSGSGKTTWAIQLAEALFVATGKRTRWYLGDGGGETVEAAGLIDDGIVEVMHYNLWPYPFETTMRICRGWWPADPTVPGSPLIAPDLGKLADQVGLHVFEGISVMCDYMIGDREGGLRARNARGDKIKEAGIQFRDGESTFGTNSAANFGTTQEQILTRIEESHGLPGWVVWTAHETLAEDKKKLGPKDGSGPTISAGIEYGPDVIGQAMTPTIGALFGNTVHLHPAMKVIDGKEADPVTRQQIKTVQIVYRAYTRRHIDPHLASTVRYYANNRMPPAYADLMPEYLAPPDPLRFYEILEQAKAQMRERRRLALSTR